MSTQLVSVTGKDTKQILLDASFKNFLINEYGKVTFDELEKVTGYSRGVFLYYYNNKINLFKQVINMYLFSQLNPEHPVFSNKIKTFGEYLAYRIKRQNKIGDWFTKNGITGNPYKLMHHLSVQALFHYPDFREKYMLYIYDQRSDWLKAVQLGMRNGEIPQKNNKDGLVTLFWSYFKVTPLSTNSVITHNDIKELCSNIGIIIR